MRVWMRDINVTSYQKSILRKLCNQKFIYVYFKLH